MRTTARQDSRTSLRHTCCAELQVMYRGTTQQVNARAPDISSRGMFIPTPQLFPVGAELQLHFRLAHTGRQVQTRAEVRYCLQGIGVGVEFKGMPNEMRYAIERETCASGW